MHLPSEQRGTDAEPAVAICDLCRHRHACYTGGAPKVDHASTSWALHVCLGCLMRAGVTNGFDSCFDCANPTAGGERVHA